MQLHAECISTWLGEGECTEWEKLMAVVIGETALCATSELAQEAPGPIPYIQTR